MEQLTIRTPQDSKARFEHLLVMPGKGIQESIIDHRSIYNTHEFFYSIINSYSIIMYLNGLEKSNVDTERYIKEHPFTKQFERFMYDLKQGRKKNIVTCLHINNLSELDDLKNFQVRGVVERHFDYDKWLLRIFDQSVLV